VVLVTFMVDVVFITGTITNVVKMVVEKTRLV